MLSGTIEWDRLGLWARDEHTNGGLVDDGTKDGHRHLRCLFRQHLAESRYTPGCEM